MLALAVKPEGVFEVRAVNMFQVEAGKDIIELEIGDSPLPTPEGNRR